MNNIQTLVHSHQFYVTGSRRYIRRLHLQNDVDCDERGDVNIYKVDQLTTLKWSVSAWEEISDATVENYFSHAGIFFVSSSLPSVADHKKHMV